METPLALRLLAVAFFVAANAFFVAAEFALVSVRPTRLRQLEAEGHSGAKTALRLHSHMDRVLSATQLGITLASLALGWVGEQTMADLLLPLLTPLAPVLRLAVAHSVALSVAFLIITAMHLVLGELVPKNVALARSDRLALLLARPMDLFLRATHPFLRVLDTAATAMSRLFGAASAEHRHVHSPEELKMLITAGREGGLLPEFLESMVRNVLDLGNVLVREVMAPRPDLVTVSVSTPLEELVRKLAERPLARVPVYEGPPENFIGVLHRKDLFRMWAEQQAAQRAGRPRGEFHLRSLVRDVPIVPETKRLDELLEEFKQRRRELALVVDEYGTIVGLVTLRDVLERIVGELADEHAAEELRAGGVAAAGLVLEGSTRIHELEERWEIRLPRDRGFETLAGFLLSLLGRIPRVGEACVFDGWRFTVEAMEHHRIASVRLDPVEGPPESSASEPSTIA